jgi:NAD(P)-dependent dehydrogenase (short-subunit alcohol dehydrogenase family)/putative sterol carrier protein
MPSSSPGGQRDGSGHSASPADAVVDEIRQAGGSAVASYDSVASPDGAQKIVQTALDHFGRLDILINNAGILRDKSFAKLEPDMWHAVLDVHLHGAFYVTQPAFQVMRQQGYGRIVFTTSAAGLFGNFGQANYSAAKMALVGLMNTLKLEGAKYDIRVNTVAPLALTRLTEDVLPPDLAAKLQPEYVTPLVLYLCSERCAVSGQVYNAGAGFFGRASVLSGPGVQLAEDGRPPSPEAIAAHWGQITSLAGAEEYHDANAALMAMFAGPKPPPPKAEPQPQPEAAEPAQNVAAIFESMGQHFQPAAAAGVDVVFQFHITGPGGGDWQVVVKDGGCTVASGVHASPTTTLTMSDADFINYVGGRLPAMQAYTSGRLKIGGDLMKSQLIEKLFRF